MKRFVADPNATQSVQLGNTVPLSAIELPTKRQPRRYFAPDKMAQHVASVKEHGILEPVLVRPLGEETYELIAGERRLRAAKEIGLAEIPVVCKEFSDLEALQVALMENLQRDDLNPLEETEAVLELLALTLDTNIEEVKSIIYQGANAKNRGQELKKNVSLQLEKLESCLQDIGRFNLESLRSSRLPLLNLPWDVLSALREGKLEYTKARTIARLRNGQQRQELLNQVLGQNLSLAEIKARLKKLKPEAEASTEQMLVERMAEITKRLKKNKGWSERKKKERITKLLDELEKLTEEG